MTQAISQNLINQLQQAKPDTQSLFSLKRANSSPTAPYIMVSFSLPATSLLPHPISLVPTFNNDKKFYTPSFIHTSQINKFITNDQGYRMIHQKKIQEMEQQHTEIYVPKPSRANSYCCICREPFEDYLTHVSITKHIHLMKKSPYYHLIEEICDQNGQGSTNSSSKKINQKTDAQRQLVAKKKKIIKIVSNQDEPKRKRGRPRKDAVPNNKLQMLASIPTSVSISF